MKKSKPPRINKNELESVPSLAASPTISNPGSPQLISIANESTSQPQTRSYGASARSRGGTFTTQPIHTGGGSVSASALPRPRGETQVRNNNAKIARSQCQAVLHLMCPPSVIELPAGHFFPAHSRNLTLVSPLYPFNSDAPSDAKREPVSRSLLISEALDVGFTQADDVPFSTLVAQKAYTMYEQGGGSGSTADQNGGVQSKLFPLGDMDLRPILHGGRAELETLAEVERRIENHITTLAAPGGIRRRPSRALVWREAARQVRLLVAMHDPFFTKEFINAVSSCLPIVSGSTFANFLRTIFGQQCFPVPFDAELAFKMDLRLRLFYYVLDKKMHEKYTESVLEKLLEKYCGSEGDLEGAMYEEYGPPRPPCEFFAPDFVQMLEAEEEEERQQKINEAKLKRAQKKKEEAGKAKDTVAGGGAEGDQLHGEDDAHGVDSEDEGPSSLQYKLSRIAEGAREYLRQVHEKEEADRIEAKRLLNAQQQGETVRVRSFVDELEAKYDHEDYLRLFRALNIDARVFEQPQPTKGGLPVMLSAPHVGDGLGTATKHTEIAAADYDLL